MINLKRNWFWCLAITLAIPYIIVKNFHSSNSSDQFWAAYWIVFNNLVLIETLGALLVYTYETYLLRKLTMDESRKTLMPILVNVKSIDNAWTIKNVGNGPALNVGCVIWNGKKLKNINPQHMVGAIPKDGVSSYQNVNLQDIDSSEYKKMLPQYFDLVKKLIDRNSGFLLLTYRDVVGIKFYSVHYTDNSSTYESAFDFGLVD